MSKTSLSRLVSLLALSFLLSVAAFADKDHDRDHASGVTIPVTGSFTDAAGGVGKFAGNLNVQRFTTQGNTMYAVGVLTGTLSDSAGTSLGSILNTVAVPITPKTSLTTAAPTAAQAASCEILNLVLGPLDLNLLGLTVHLDQVVLNITAVPGAGNLLGNLLCAVTNLLNSGGALTQVTNLLNQILGILGGLGL